MSIELTLKAIGGELDGQEFTLRSPTYCVLGRSRSCTLRLPGDATVSRQHCVLELDTQGVWVQDLGSLNGTHINGEKIGQRERYRSGDATMVQPPRQALCDGDILRVCNNTFAVRLRVGEEAKCVTAGSEWDMALCI